METEKLILEEVKHIDMYHFQMYEGRFKDVSQTDAKRESTYIYANVSNFDGSIFEESEVRIYAHSYEELFDAANYELVNLYGDAKLCEYLKAEILKGISGIKLYRFDCSLKKEIHGTYNDCDEWDVATLWLNDKQGAEYNFCMDSGKSVSAIYKTDVEVDTGVVVDVSIFEEYHIDFENPNWMKELEQKMYTVAKKFFATEE